MRCLLIWPPRTSPSAVPGSLLACADHLGRRGCDVEVQDASLGFFRERLARTGTGGGPTSAGPEAGMVELLGTREFFTPEQFLRAVGDGAAVFGGRPPDPSAGAEFLNRHLPAWVLGANADLVVILGVDPARQQVSAEVARDLGVAAAVPVHWVDNTTQIIGLGPEPDTSSGVLTPAVAELASGPYLTPGPVLAFAGAVGGEATHDLLAGLTTQLAPAGFVFGGDAVGRDPDAWLRAGPLAATHEVPASVSLPVKSDLSPEALEAAHANGLRVIRWQWDGSPGPRFDKTLARTSALGIWNHLTVPPDRASHPIAGFAARNPNIVHSVTSVPDAEVLPFQPLPVQAAARSGYEGLRPLPGDPFWRWLGDPAHLLLYVVELGKKRLAHLRVMGSPPRCQFFGSAISYRFLPPAELEDGQVDEICSLVRSGGAVGDRWLRHNLERAHLIAVAEETGVIVGCSSLKHPRVEYVERVRDKVGLDIAGYLERGYTSVRPEYRGLGVGTKLLEGLTSRAAGRPIYSVIREDDHATQTIALRNRTRKVASFYSERADKDIGIWMPEQQLIGGADAE